MNGGGNPIVVDVTTTARPLSNTGLGSRTFSAVRFFVKASIVAGVGSTVNSKELVVKKGVTEFEIPIQATGEWESVGSMRLDPDGVAWNGTSIDSVEVFVKVNAAIPPGVSVSLSVKEIRAEVVDYHVASGGVAGHVVGVGEVQ